jgi:hypothetical protein
VTATIIQPRPYQAPPGEFCLDKEGRFLTSKEMQGVWEVKGVVGEGAAYHSDANTCFNRSMISASLAFTKVGNFCSV